MFCLCLPMQLKAVTGNDAFSWSRWSYKSKCCMSLIWWWMDGWMNERTDRWIDGWMDGPRGIDGQTSGGTGGWIEGGMGGLMDGWGGRYGWTEKRKGWWSDGWMNGQTEAWLDWWLEGGMGTVGTCYSCYYSYFICCSPSCLLQILMCFRCS